MKSRILLLSGLFACTGVLAGPEKIKFPSDYLKGVLYQTLDRHDVKQYRELYTQPEVVEAVRKGQPIPSGTVLTLVQWSVHQDDKGNPLKGPDGRFIKKDVLAHTVMEKRTGWGADYPADWPRKASGSTPCSSPMARPVPRGTPTTRPASPATCRTPSRTS